MTTNSISIKSLMKTAEYRALSDLCEKHPHIFSMEVSPNFEQLRDFDERFRKSPYVQGLLESGHLDQAINKLENEYAKLTSLREFVLGGDSEESRQHKKYKRLERRVRFIHRLAKLIGPSDRTHLFAKITGSTDKPFAYVKRSDQNKLRKKKIVPSLSKAREQLCELWKDEFFKETLVSADLDFLHQFIHSIEKAEKIVAEAEPDYVIKTVPDQKTALAKTLINRLADVCYRIYGHCDKTIIEHLTSYDWLSFTFDITNIDDLIEATSHRKQELFKLRTAPENEKRAYLTIPKEDSESVELDGEWGPARNINPPWMNGWMNVNI
jgi:hypothetical protein